MGLCKSKHFTKLNENTKYTLGQKIGEGSFGKIYMCKNDYSLCIKVISKHNSEGYISTRNILNVYNEIKILEYINHENILKFVSSIENKESIYIVYNYISGIDFIDYASNYEINEKLSIHFLKTIISVLVYLHSKTIVHGDLKCDNIIINPINNKLTIIDFGSSHFLNQKKENVIGTDGYKAPELYIKHYNYDMSIDIYSMGCIAYALLKNKLPFRNSYYYSVTKIEDIKPFRRYISKASNNYNNLVKGCLSHPYTRYPTDLVKIHPLFNKGNLEKNMIYLHKFINFYFDYEIDNKYTRSIRNEYIINREYYFYI